MKGLWNKIVKIEEEIEKKWFIKFECWYMEVIIYWI